MIDHHPDTSSTLTQGVAFGASNSINRRSRARTTLPYNGMAPAIAGSTTSEAAAKRIEPTRLTKKARVYGFILSRGAEGATRPEIAEALGMSENTVRPRVCELYAAWSTTHQCPEVKEAPDGRERNGCAVLLAAPFYAAAVRPALVLTSEDAADEA